MHELHAYTAQWADLFLPKDCIRVDSDPYAASEVLTLKAHPLLILWVWILDHTYPYRMLQSRPGCFLSSDCFSCLVLWLQE